MAALNGFVPPAVIQPKKHLRLSNSPSSHQYSGLLTPFFNPNLVTTKFHLAHAFTEDSAERKTCDGNENEENASVSRKKEETNYTRMFGFDFSPDRLLNAAIVLASGSLAITKLLTIDHDYWHGWTLYEVFRYAPEHNWNAYEEALKTNPVLAKMVISGIVYSLGDWIAQCYEGKPLFEFDRARMFRSGFVGFTLHGSLSHFYYQFCEALFPSKDWWVVPAKVAFDQSLWAAAWNSIYFVVLGFLRLDSPVDVFDELKATFWPMLTAGWKLWPFAHLITYGVIPVEQRLLWVDCVELIWVTILSTYSNEKSEVRISEASESRPRSTPDESPEFLSILAGEEGVIPFLSLLDKSTDRKLVNG